MNAPDRMKEFEEKVAGQIKASPRLLSVGTLVALMSMGYTMWTAQGRDDQSRDQSARTEERIQSSIRRIWDRILQDEDKSREIDRLQRQEMIEAVRHETELACRDKGKCS
jgi:hypothetical protein